MLSQNCVTQYIFTGLKYIFTDSVFIKYNKRGCLSNKYMNNCKIKINNNNKKKIHAN